MLSYQHAYHAGNLADVHKHALLAVALDRLAQKAKPLTYIETHAGRGLYDLAGAEAAKTGEAAAGIARTADWFAPDHPYRRTLAACRAAHGPSAYPGSPWIAAHLTRPGDTIWLAERHPAEAEALRANLAGHRVHIREEDGFALARSILPPTPRRGIMLIDPSWEMKDDYAAMPAFLRGIATKWNVGILALWLPILADARHAPMLARLGADHPDALLSTVRFAPARAGHGMIGSALFVVNPPYGLADEAAAVAARFAAL